MVGFCFSFPVEQVAINSGLLIRWTKGFDISGGEHKDPVVLLSEAFHRQVCHAGLNLQLCAGSPTGCRPDCTHIHVASASQAALLASVHWLLHQRLPAVNLCS